MQLNPGGRFRARMHHRRSTLNAVAGPQNSVTPEDRTETAIEYVNVQPAGQPHSNGDVIQVACGIKLIQEEQSFLRERKAVRIFGLPARNARTSFDADTFGLQKLPNLRTIVSRHIANLILCRGCGSVADNG